MDFNNSPDFGDLPLPDPNAQTNQGVPPPPDFDVSPSAPAVDAEAADTAVATPVEPPALGTSSRETLDRKHFIYTLLIALFITLVIGAIVLFGVSMYMKANEPPPTTSNYTFGSGSVAQVTKAPTATPEKAPAAASPSAAIVPTKAKDWRIRMKLKNVKMSTFTDPKLATLSATLFGPIKKDEYVCTSAGMSDTQYFNFMKSKTEPERLCDAVNENKSVALTCAKYDTDLGVPITQTLYPKTDCSEGTIEAGTYVMHSKVYFNCDLAGKSLSDITPEACKDSAEVNSEEMTVEE
jgi:hypothetical protein